MFDKPSMSCYFQRRGMHSCAEPQAIVEKFRPSGLVKRPFPSAKLVAMDRDAIQFGRRGTRRRSSDWKSSNTFEKRPSDGGFMADIDPASACLQRANNLVRDAKNKAYSGWKFGPAAKAYFTEETARVFWQRPGAARRLLRLPTPRLAHF